MTGDLTQVQSDEDRLRARELSLQRQQPPTQVPGYEPERFLGAGAYGEVWVARDRNTSRQVAIKFYAHRGGLDWSLLSREVDKLALLFSDRHFVQLVEVGWNADPPYYVMEYLGRGSLEDRLSSGPIPVPEAVALFREIAVALVHAHGKGILHCDLKPANVLLDQDDNPRLADFGQSRLSHEQTPALGTMFYMSPEQADLKAAPDARWDVYALGAILYCMLTGQPPYRDSTLADEISRSGDTLGHRLRRYRQAIQRSPRPTGHRHVPGIDHALIEIIDRCLAPSPSHRFPNAQAVLDALKARAIRRARWPLLLLGALGPALLLSVVSLLAWNGFHMAVNESTKSLILSARVGNEFAAQVFADHIAMSVDRRWRIMEEEANDPEFQALVSEAAEKPREHEARVRVQKKLEGFHASHSELPSVAWVLFGPTGTMLARSPIDEKTIGKNFAFRDFFHGRGTNLPEGSQTSPITEVHRSIVYRSQATGHYRTVAFSVPIWSGESDQPDRHVIGVLITSVEVGDYADFRPPVEPSKDLVPVLIDTAKDEHGRRGAVLSHPYLAELRQGDPTRELPDIYVDPSTVEPWDEDYYDPVAQYDPQYSGRWLAASEPVLVEGRHVLNHDTGWRVIMQERYNSVIGPVLELKRILVKRGVMTLIAIILILTALWGVVIGVLNHPTKHRFASYLQFWRRASESLSATSGGSPPAPPVSSEPAPARAEPPVVAPGDLSRSGKEPAP
jgi:eukaryotic-like serine/threonine-protein kinase